MSKGTDPEVPSASEQELVGRARAGDRQALGRLLEQHQGSVWRFTERMCRSRQDAEDVLQEALTGAIRDFPRFRGEASFRTWLFSIVRNACSKFYARSGATRVSAEEEAAHESTADGGARSPELWASTRELADAVVRAIHELPRAQREALVLRDIEGFSAEEVAEVTHSSVDAVKSRLHRARRTVQRRAAEIAEPRLLERQPALAPSTCPDILQLFSQRLEGDVNPALCARMQEHVDRCADCQARCDGLERTLAVCQAVPLGPVPAHIRDAVHRALRRPVPGS